MRKKIAFVFFNFCISIILWHSATSQHYRFTVVNMTPAARSPETFDDGEPNIAVNPANPQIIAASAFTFANNGTPCLNPPSPCTGVQFPNCRAPIYLSVDGGNTWQLRQILPSNNGITHDITLAFGSTGYLYAGILKGCQFPDVFRGFMTLRSASNSNAYWTSPTLTDMREVDNKFGAQFDQPWIVACGARDPGNQQVFHDQVFVGVNRNQNRRSAIPAEEGKTARIIFSNNAESPTPIFNARLIETVGTAERNLSGIRVAAHSSGKVYAIFYRWKSGGLNAERLNAGFRTELSPPNCDVVVVRDDHLGTESIPFGALGGPAGIVVANDQVVPISYPQLSYMGIDDGGKLGNVRLVGANLSIAVDPNNDQHVFIAWCAKSNNSYQLYFSQSWDGGLTWSNNGLPPLPSTLNPAIAMTTDNKVGFLYQKLTDDGWWETHFTVKHWVTSTPLPLLIPQAGYIPDYVLNRFRDNELPLLDLAELNKRPSLGEYLDLEAVGNSFYGVFSAFNKPDSSSGRQRNWRFPEDVRFNRHQDQKTGQLVNAPGGSPVRNSVDPFFFKAEVFPSLVINK